MLIRQSRKWQQNAAFVCQLPPPSNWQFESLCLDLWGLVDPKSFVVFWGQLVQ